MAQQTFGGDWTQEKLELLSKYLREYTKIFDKNPKARYFKTVYVDAFAGTGSYTVKGKETTSPVMFEDHFEAKTDGFFKGSAQRALEIEPKFHQYLFIERDPNRCNELEALKQQFLDVAANIQIANDDATNFLTSWCRSENWNKTRAVLFLDPFGMEVDWSLLEEVAATHGIDMWLWFPISGVNRHLTVNKPPPPEWANRVTRVLGTDEWMQEWYPVQKKPNLFGDDESQAKDTDFERIAAFVVKRLKTIFPGVSESPRLFRNSNNVPLYLFCFATGATNESPRNAALRIANYLLKKG